LKVGVRGHRAARAAPVRGSAPGWRPSESGVRSIWLRHDLANFKVRLKVLEAKMAENGGILTEAQVQALEKKKHDDEACGEIEAAHPGYLGSQDTFYVGTLKGVGRVYQQAYVDTYCDRMNPLTTDVSYISP